MGKDLRPLTRMGGRIYRQVGRQQKHENSAGTGLLSERPESSNKCAAMGAETGIRYSQNQWVCFDWEK
jgi:hypothetical protein